VNKLHVTEGGVGAFFAGNQLLVTSLSGTGPLNVNSYQPTSGKELWSVQSSGDSYFISKDLLLTWEYNPNTPESSPIEAFNVHTGKKEWQSDPVQNGEVAGVTGNYVVTTGAILNASNGETVRTLTSAQVQQGFLGIGKDGVLVADSGGNGPFSYASTSNGKFKSLWTVPNDSMPVAIGASDVITSGNNAVYSISLKTGRIVATNETNDLSSGISGRIDPYSGAAGTILMGQYQWSYATFGLKVYRGGSFSPDQSTFELSGGLVWQLSYQMSNGPLSVQGEDPITGQILGQLVVPSSISGQISEVQVGGNMAAVVTNSSENPDVYVYALKTSNG
jgi:hypothetical protein